MFLSCETAIPNKEFDWASSPKDICVELYNKYVGIDCNQFDFRQAETIFKDKALYLVYVALSPMVKLEDKSQWVPISEVFNEQTDGLVKELVSSAIPYA